MAGHNKWSKIKRLKGVTDARRGQMFSKLSREITLAARSGGGDLETNFRLRNAVKSARDQNMPNDNIDRAIKKGTGELAGDNYDEVLYEGFGPAGVAFLIEAATNNKNRTSADLRNIFTKNHGNFGASGSVAHQFAHRGEILTAHTTASEDQLLELILEAGAQDLQPTDPGIFQILTNPADLAAVGDALRAARIPIESQKFTYIPGTLVTVSDPLDAAKVLKLYEALDDNDDTSAIHANFDIAEDLL